MIIFSSPVIRAWHNEIRVWYKYCWSHCVLVKKGNFWESILEEDQELPESLYKGGRVLTWCPWKTDTLWIVSRKSQSRNVESLLLVTTNLWIKIKIMMIIVIMIIIFCSSTICLCSYLDWKIDDQHRKKHHFVQKYTNLDATCEGWVAQCVSSSSWPASC